MEKNKVIMENGEPKVILNEVASAMGGVSIEEAKVLAFQVAQKIIREHNRKKHKTQNVDHPAVI